MLTHKEGEYDFAVEDYSSAKALEHLESWLRAQPRLHEERKAQREKESKERMKKYEEQDGKHGKYMPGDDGDYSFGGMHNEL